MKKETKRKILITFSIIIGVIFLLEIITMPLLYSNKEEQEKQDIEKFVNQWVFNSSLSEQEKKFLISRGVTIVSYYYTNKNNLINIEHIVDSLKGQLILELIKSDKDEIHFESARNTIVIKNITTEKFIEGMCKTLNYPPIDCSSVIRD